MNLDDFEKLLAAATPRPWNTPESSGLTCVHSPTTNVGLCLEPRDAALIVAAVNALPSLIASARRVEGLEKAARALLDNLELSIAPAYGSKEHNALTSRAVDDYGERVRDLEAALQPPTAKET